MSVAGLGGGKIMFSLGILWWAQERGIACAVPPCKRGGAEMQIRVPSIWISWGPQSVAMSFSPFSVEAVWCPLGRGLLSCN